MKVIRHTKTLYYYDGPQVFEARDSIGGHYVALMVASEPSGDRYVVAGVPPERMRLFRTGALDLRSLMIDAAPEECYLASFGDSLDAPLLITQEGLSLEAGAFLPDDGFLIHDRETTELTLHEARKRQNFVVEVAVDPPEAAEDSRVRMDTLAGLLIHVQGIIKYAYRRVPKPVFRRSDGYLMDVVIPAAPGSFRVILEEARLPDANLDLFGYSGLPPALRRIDLLFEHVSVPEQTLDVLQSNRGHLAGSFLRLLRFLQEHETGFRYSWAEPTSETAHGRAVLESQVPPLVESLSEVADLGVESVVLEGEFVKFDRRTGRWGLLVDGTVASGKIKEDGPSLDGLSVGHSYRFYCIEEIATVIGTGRESHTLYLTKHESLWR